MDKNIVCDGVVVSYNPAVVRVRMTSSKACAECGARHRCMSAGAEDSMVEIHNPSEIFEEGEQVLVSYSGNLGRKAVFLAYCLPVVLVVAALILSWAAGCSELGSAFVSLAALVLFYGVLFLFRARMNSAFRFYIGKK